MRRHHLGTLTIVLLFFAACSDLSTTPGAKFPERRLASLMQDSPHGPGRGTTPYFCSASRVVARDPDRYEYGVLPVQFPRQELVPDGATMVYRVMSYGGEGEVAGRADCLIPRTDAAKARIQRLFRKKGHGAGAGGSATIQSVPIDGVYVETCRYGGEPPHCNYAPPMLGMGDVECSAADSGCGTGGGGDPYASDGWSWGSAGGDDPEPPSPDDGTNRDPCRRDAKGNCVTEPVDSRELQEILNKIQQMADYPRECAEAKRYAQELFSQGADRFRVWNGYDTYPDSTKPNGRGQTFGYNTSDAKGRILVFDSHWLFEDPSLVAHEFLHYYLYRINSPLMGDDNEAFADDWEEICD